MRILQDVRACVERERERERKKVTFDSTFIKIKIIYDTITHLFIFPMALLK